MFQENKARQIFRKTNIFLPPDTHTYVCVYIRTKNKFQIRFLTKTLRNRLKRGLLKLYVCHVINWSIKLYMMILSYRYYFHNFNVFERQFFCIYFLFYLRAYIKFFLESGSAGQLHRISIDQCHLPNQNIISIPTIG